MASKSSENEATINKIQFFPRLLCNAQLKHRIRRDVSETHNSVVPWTLFFVDQVRDLVVQALELQSQTDHALEGSDKPSVDLVKFLVAAASEEVLIELLDN